MALLGQSWDDPQTAGILALAAGLMEGRPSQGIMGMMQAMSGQEDRKLRRGLLESQIEENRSQAEARRLAAQKAQELQDYMKGLFPGGDISAPQVSPGAFAPASDGYGPTMPQSMASQARPGSRLANLGIDQIAGLKALGGPDLLEAYKWINDPMKFEQGATYVDRATGQSRHMPRLPEGGTITDGRFSFVPDYAQSMASLEGAKTAAQEAARANVDLVRVVGPDGAERFVPRSTVLRGQQPDPFRTAPQQPAQPTQTPSQFRVTPDEQRGRDAEALRIIQSEIDSERDPQTKAALQREFDRMKTAQGGRGFPAPSAVKLPQPQQVAQAGGFQATPTAEQAAQAAAAKVGAEAVAKDLAETRKNLMAAGMSAPTTIAKYQQIDKLLADVDGGALTATGTQLASALNSLGFKVDKNLSNKEAAAALGNEMALDLRSPANGAGMPGAMSDKDREFLVGMIPNASQTLEGRRQLIQAKIAIEQRKQQVASFARNYENKYGKLDNGFFEQLQAWSNANTLFGGK